jgi:hypothetical protein
MEGMLSNLFTQCYKAEDHALKAICFGFLSTNFVDEPSKKHL